MVDVTDDAPWPEPETLRLRCELAQKAVDRHASLLDGLRNRANILLTAGGVIATLFGAAVLPTFSSAHGGRQVFALLALVATLLGLFCCLGVILPVPDEGPLNTALGATLQWQRVGRIYSRGLSRLWPNRAGGGRDSGSGGAISGPLPSAVPSREWQVTVTPGSITDRMDVQAIQAATIAQLEQARKVNFLKIQDLNFLVTWASLVLIAQFLLWALALLAH
jgi:hypothetical protein